MLMPEKEEEYLYFYDLGFDYSKSIFSYNKDDNILNQNDLIKDEAKIYLKPHYITKRYPKKKKLIS